MAQAPHVALALVALLAAGACDSRAARPRPAQESPAVAAAPAADGVVRRAAAARVVAIGDLHGDLEATRKALRLAGAIDDGDRWIGGKLVVVQCGDQLDRGDDEPEILALFDRLAVEAAATGGAVVPLNGNHELMNVAGDFRYVTGDGFVDYGGAEARRAAFAPGGPVARRLAGRPIYAIVGDTLFAHGGVLPAHVEHGLERLDGEARAWLRGEQAAPPLALTDEDSPLWTRVYGLGLDDACTAATVVLTRLGLSRMVVAHTPQEEGVNAICEGRVWRVDAGLARHYGGPLEVLELRGDAAVVLR